MLFINHIELLDNRAAIIEIKGALNGTTVADFQDYTTRLIGRNITYIMIDASGLEYLSSEGIGMFLLMQRHLSGINGFFTIFNLNDEINALCSLLGFHSLFHITRSRDEALHLVDRQMDLRASGATAPPPAVTSSPVAPETESIAVDHAETLVVDCAKCGSLLRIQADGTYACPDCGYEFIYSASTGIIHKDDRPAPKPIEPFVIECIRCGELIRVRMTGDYNCPHCQASFNVGEDHHVAWSK